MDDLRELFYYPFLHHPEWIGCKDNNNSKDPEQIPSDIRKFPAEKALQIFTNDRVA